MAAHSLRAVPLEDALELVLLGASRVDKDRYEQLATRILVQLRPGSRWQTARTLRLTVR